MEELSFSVSMCVYGKDNPIWFGECVESILSQTILPNEIVLVVDGPVPEELDTFIKKYESLDIFNVIRLETNQGHGNARRISLENCKNNLVAIMDADDICVKNRFEKQIDMFKNNNSLDIVGGNISEFIDNIDNIVGKRIVMEKDAEIKQDLKKRCPMNQVTVMFKKSSIQSVGGYIDWYCEEDYYLWIRMVQANMKFANINENLVFVRVGKEMYQRRGGWKYFKSEYALQKYMRKNKIINFPTFTINSIKRFIVQVLLPNKIRGWVFKKFARK